ncbi:MAG: hypothetical protein BMS9Abin36_1879 [Gammaproteobacteria bacterium]|nr:MAG: hypothetical protein BMS9Abin36_1879 [Gammaproteobacteria bacterium]
MGLFTDYEIDSVIAEGGMATVYKCKQISLDRPVAVKVLSQQLMRQHPAIVDYFEQESLIIAKLSHPNIIHVIDRGISGGLPFFVMEFVEGRTLDRILSRDRLDVTQKLDIAVQIVKAMAYAHRNGVIHRDIKPSNILVDSEGNVQIMDFGISQLITKGDDKAVTDSLVMGTEAYMSPEQKVGVNTLTTATDMYSLGLVLYEMFTGERPDIPPRQPSGFDANNPTYIDKLIMACLEPNPGSRPDAVYVRDQLLEAMRGVHLDEEKKQQVLEDVTDVKVRFALLDILAETQYAAVYLFENTHSRKLLVIKKITENEKGFKEAQTLSSLRHTGIIDIYGVSKNERAFIIVMEYLPGGSLKDRLARGWPWKEALQIMVPVCEGLAIAHKNNLTHGNLRPSNILFTESGEAKLTDFCLDEHYKDSEKQQNWYAIKNEARTPATDIYSLGVILYQMLFGVLPSWNRNELQVVKEFKTIPFDLQDMLRRMLQRVPKDRYKSMDDVLTIMDGLLMFRLSRKAGNHTRTSGMGPTFAIAAVIMLLASMITYWVLQGPPVILASYFNKITTLLGLN